MIKGKKNTVVSICETDCYGCGACATMCQTGGVELALNINGYYKRHIVIDKCISCGKCLKGCPVSDCPEELNDDKTYVGHAILSEDVFNSSSGGFAYILSKHFLQKGYVIVGAAWAEKAKEVKHIIIQDENELNLLRKSKYIQSYTVDAFKKLKSIERAVIIGTPCQIAGLRKVYSQKKDFIFVDFDCMGPAGYQLWRKYYNYLTTINSSGIEYLAMRTKRNSWMHYGTQVLFCDGKEYYGDKFKDPFCKLYHFAHLIQTTCRNCKYLNASKADIRIGDAWAYTEGFSKEEIKHGLSVITPVTEDGTKIWDELSKVYIFKKTIRNPLKPLNDDRNENLWQMIREDSKTIDDICNAYDDVPITKRMYRKLSILLSSNDSIYLFAKKLMRHKA